MWALGRGTTLYAYVYMHVFENREHVNDSRAFSGGMHLGKSHMHIGGPCVLRSTSDSGS